MARLRKDPARIGVYHLIFFDICQESYAKFLDLSCDTLKHGIITIVFAGLCIEAAIYDYAARYLGDNYVKEYLEKMELLSKWIVLPKLIHGKEIRKGKVTYASLKQLIRDRNKLVHVKSEQFNFDDQELIAKLNRKAEQSEMAVHNAYKALILLCLEMDYLVGPEYNPIQSLDKEVNLVPIKIPKILQPVFAEIKSSFCRSIVENA